MWKETRGNIEHEQARDGEVETTGASTSTAADRAYGITGHERE
jgi:hypothetical protein